MSALATKPDVEARLGRSLTASEAARADTLLEDASAAVIGYCRDAFDNYEETVPAAVTGVVAKMVARAFERAASSAKVGIESVQTGPFATNFTAAASSDDIWLSSADKLALRGHRNAVTSIGVYGNRYTDEPATEELP